MGIRRWDDKAMADLCLALVSGMSAGDMAKDNGVSTSRILQVFHHAMRRIAILNKVENHGFSIYLARANAAYWIDQIEKFKKERVQ